MELTTIIYWAIIALVIYGVLTGGYYLYRRINGTWNTMPSDKKVWTITDTKSQQGSEGSFLAWFYLEDVIISDKEMPILEYKSEDLTVSIFMNTKKSAYRVIVQKHKYPERVEMIHAVPMQKWVHVGVVIHDRTIELYLDGNLRGVRQFKNPPEIQDKATVYYTPANIVGEVQGVEYVNRGLSADEIRAIYARGRTGMFSL